MKVILCLSGQTGKSARWHRERDSIAGSVHIPEDVAEKFLDALATYGVLDDETHLNISDPELMPSVDHRAVNDMCSNIVDNGQADPLFGVAKLIRILCRSEIDCGTLHLTRCAA